MTDIRKLLDTIQTIHSHCEAMDELRQRNSTSFQREKEILARDTKDLTDRMRNELDRYLQTHLGRIEEQMDKLCALLKRDYKKKVGSARGQYAQQDEQTNVQQLHQLVAQLNAQINGLNNVDFDALEPPENLVIREVEFDGASGTCDFTIKPSIGLS